MGGVVKGVAAGIGLASESIKARKERKAAREAGEAGSEDFRYSGGAEAVGENAVFITDVDGRIYRAVEVEQAVDEALSSHCAEGDIAAHLSEANLEKVWMLDEEQEKLPRSRSPSPVPQGKTQHPNSLADDFLLQNTKSTQANPLLSTMNLAAVGLEFAPIPSIYGLLAAIGIHQATIVAMELNSWSNKAVNVNNHVAGTIASSLIVPSEGTRKRLAHNLQASSGDYFGDLGAMDTAPLVYPKLEELARGKRARMKAVGSFVSDYKDRRAQAEWASENSMSILAQGPRPQFRSRFSDPNHPASSGDILALVTAGKLSTSSLKEKMSSNSSIDVNHDSNSPSPSMPQSGGGHRAPRDNRRVPLVCNHENITPSPYGGYSEPPNFPPPRYTNHPEQYAGAYQYNRNTQANRNKEPRDSDDEEQTYGKKEKLGGTRGVLRSVLKKNVLYMMIVNLPSEAEMMQAQISLKGQQGNWRMQ